MMRLLRRLRRQHMSPAQAAAVSTPEERREVLARLDDAQQRVRMLEARVAVLMRRDDGAERER